MNSKSYGKVPTQTNMPKGLQTTQGQNGPDDKGNGTNHTPAAWPSKGKK